MGHSHSRLREISQKELQRLPEMIECKSVEVDVIQQNIFKQKSKIKSLKREMDLIVKENSFSRDERRNLQKTYVQIKERIHKNIKLTYQLENEKERYLQNLAAQNNNLKVFQDYITSTRSELSTVTLIKHDLHRPECQEDTLRNKRKKFNNQSDSFFK
eukprot:NODE_139_length_17940_cov_0.254190.p8 type:complete len:158 gc:universal NODE_139_length_17940_cov_0.254190:17500-17027(-)